MSDQASQYSNLLSVSVSLRLWGTGLKVIAAAWAVFGIWLSTHDGGVMNGPSGWTATISGTIALAVSGIIFSALGEALFALMNIAVDTKRSADAGIDALAELRKPHG